MSSRLLKRRTFHTRAEINVLKMRVSMLEEITEKLRFDLKGLVERITKAIKASG